MEDKFYREAKDILSSMIENVTEDMINTMSDALKNQYKQGIIEYAWWKNGEQFVGSCGTPLKKALENI